MLLLIKKSSITRWIKNMHHYTERAIISSLSRVLILKKMKGLHIVTFILLVVGGLNWLLVGLGYNLVEIIVGAGSMANLIYILVGISAIIEVVTHKKTCKMCTSKEASGQSVM
jgi:uncharacterized protein